jgi:hypothetical protein
MTRSSYVKKILFALALLTTLGLGLIRTGTAKADASSDWEQFQQDWLEMYLEVRAMYPGQGACNVGEPYRWTGPTPLHVPFWETTGPEGAEVQIPDPVAPGELMCDLRWVRVPDAEAEALLAEMAFMPSSSGTDEPGTCTAMLYINPGSSNVEFTCSSGPCTPPTTCQASNSTPAGKPYGFCGCNVVPPTDPGAKCTGTFTPEPNRWEIDCSGSCENGEETCKIVHVQDEGGPLWYWCDCVVE